MTESMRYFLAAFLFLCAPALAADRSQGPADAPGYSAGELAGYCLAAGRVAQALTQQREPSPGDVSQSLICGSYLTGIASALSALDNVQAVRGFCVPDGGVNAETFRTLYMLFLAQHPEIMSAPAESVALIAWSKAYPCPSQ